MNVVDWLRPLHPSEGLDAVAKFKALTYAGNRIPVIQPAGSHFNELSPHRRFVM
jgi:hypothetical protein